MDTAFAESRYAVDASTTLQADDIEATEARAIAERHEVTDPHALFLLHQHAWNPAAFIDLCAALACGDARCEQLAREVALAEWRLLFDYCYTGAVA